MTEASDVHHFFVAPEVEENEGNGTEQSPWNLWSAMQNGDIPAGSVVHCARGDYKRKQTEEVDSDS